MLATTLLRIKTKLLNLVIIVGVSINLCACSLFQFSSDDNTATPRACKLVVNTAYCQLGKRYKPGGASPKGFDCSGLIYFVYKKNGYKVPRITTEQAKFGKRISKDSIREGDILVFRMGDSPRGLHTAIYTGDRCFIHSPSSGKTVKRDSVEKTYWKKGSERQE